MGAETLVRCPIRSRLLPCVAFAQRSENASLHSSTGGQPPLPDLSSGFARARLSGCLPGQSGLRPLEVEVGGSRRGAERELPALVHRLSDRALRRGGAVTSGRRYHPGRRGDRVILAAHHRHRRRRVHRGSRSCHRPAPAELPGPLGSRVLLGGGLAILDTAPAAVPAPSHLKALAHVRGQGSGSLSSAAVTMAAVGAAGRWCVWCRSVPRTTAAARRGRPGTPCPSGFQLGGEGDAQEQRDSGQVGP